MKHKLFKLQSPFKPAGDQPKAIQQLVEGLEAGLAKQVVLGVTGSGKTYTLAYVPASDVYIEKDASINEHVEQMRLSATKAILERKDTIIVATVSAIYGLGDPESYLKMMLHLTEGERIHQREILRRLAELQYVRNEADFYRATYRVRGDVIDVYPAESESEAIRIQLLDDEVESLALFDPLTSKIISKVPRVTIYPKTHYVTPRETVLEAVEKIKIELKERLQELEKNNRLVE